MSYAEFSPNSDAHGALAWLAEVPASVAVLPPPLPVMPPPLPPGPSRNYVLRHWRGECRLPVATWVNGFLGSILCVIALLASLIAFGTLLIEEVTATFWTLSAIFAALVSIMVWQCVGVWRSATRYRSGGKRFWGGLAKCVVLLVACPSAWVSATSVVPKLVEWHHMMLHDPEIGPHTFSETGNGTTLVFEGGIKFGVAEELEARLAAMDHVTTVQLESNGGRITEAEKMAHVIKARGLSTVVAGKCVSACPTVLLGGRERYLFGDARIGFHRPSNGGVSSEAIMAEEEDRLVRLGLSREFAKRTNDAMPDEMWYPAPEELLREKVVTEILRGKPEPAEAQAEKADDVAPAEVKPRGMLRAAAAD
ncbi:hypothetical protein JQ604_35320 [Bradyrhizobium jicamae]|uniref:COG3904 family protein n=1 Tax=Bradyrhizobium jicamae TaxID=280332 RepID=UPI001BAD7750|nr:hypothetical protein [Bradyrhizobium jicamae]MBR0757481.1 hypothetical protein [Bradyrhizobium jicamae]